MSFFAGRSTAVSSFAGRSTAVSFFAGRSTSTASATDGVAHVMAPVFVAVSKRTTVFPCAERNVRVYTPAALRVAALVGAPSGFSYSARHASDIGSACTFQPREQP